MRHKSLKNAAAELGLGPRAPWAEVQAAYRRLVLALHPDVNGSPESAERFRRVSDAYRRLEDRKREQETLSRVLQDSRARELPVSELVLRLRYSGSAELRRAAAFLMGRLPGGVPDDLEAARAALAAALGDRDRAVGAAAAEALARVGSVADVARAALYAAAHPAAAGAWLQAAAERGGRAAAEATRSAGAQLSRLAGWRRA